MSFVSHATISFHINYCNTTICFGIVSGYQRRGSQMLKTHVECRHNIHEYIDRTRCTVNYT